ncbi:MAG: hypothetical protein WC799_12805 [Desulfobacteraceae bacterium]|jgi:metal-responsive CopG/Arc/MetJ family transcriptional regulator
MDTVRVTITIAKDLVTTIDQLSRQAQLSRSKYITNVLREKISQENEIMIKGKYNQVFSDDRIRKEQLDMLKWF